MVTIEIGIDVAKEVFGVARDLILIKIMFTGCAAAGLKLITDTLF